MSHQQLEVEVAITSIVGQQQLEHLGDWWRQQQRESTVVEDVAAA